jgi:hypothetical protein
VSLASRPLCFVCDSWLPFFPISHGHPFWCARCGTLFSCVLIKHISCLCVWCVYVGTSICAYVNTYEEDRADKKWCLHPQFFTSLSLSPLLSSPLLSPPLLSPPLPSPPLPSSLSLLYQGTTM